MEQLAQVTQPNAGLAARAAHADGAAAADVPVGPASKRGSWRHVRGHHRREAARSSRTYLEIVRANVCTRFNALLGVLFVVIVAVGPLADGLFALVLLANIVIGIAQEVRAKWTLDHLALLHAPRARVVRDGTTVEVSPDDLVVGEVVELRAGDEVPCDGELIAADGLDVDESLLTGESDPILKAAGDAVLSGSFAVAGHGSCRATHVGADSYARRISAEARRFTVTRSELIEGINRILQLVTWVLVPAAGLLLWSQITDSTNTELAVRVTVAGIVAMVPLGLVLLTSVAFALGVIRLARAHVLVQELPAVEGLARVDVLCFDKTGTLTTGEIAFDALERFDDKSEADAALGALAAALEPNATLAALGLAFNVPEWTCTARVQFSSRRQWSGATFDEHGSWILGAPEVVLGNVNQQAADRARELSASSRRVLALGWSQHALNENALVDDLQPSALVLFTETIRAEATEILDFVRAEGIALKVISGDNPQTVRAIASQVGLVADHDAVDAAQLPDDLDALASLADDHSVFGRVTPERKRALVAALQRRGHVVAMTGDGVNDALALKDADIGIAMGTGAAATRAVAQFVLLDDSFAAIPTIVAQGRQAIANVERSAHLFVTKVAWAVALAVVVGIAGWSYPFLPRQITLIDLLTIGGPGLFLVLMSNHRRYVPGFVSRVLRFAIPSGVVIAAAVLATYKIAGTHTGVSDAGARTSALLVAVALGIGVVVLLVRTPLLVASIIGVAIALVLAVLSVPVARDFYELVVPSSKALLLVGVTTAVALAALAWVAPRAREGGTRSGRVERSARDRAVRP